MGCHLKINKIYYIPSEENVIKPALC